MEKENGSYYLGFRVWGVGGPYRSLWALSRAGGHKAAAEREAAYGSRGPLFAGAGAWRLGVLQNADLRLRV